MVPDYFVQLDALPRNDRNKIDYPTIQLLKPPVDDGEYTPPETETEKRLCEIFGSVLDIERVSVRADFFALGGTSLSAAVLIAELKHYRPEKAVSFNDIAGHPTVRALSEFLDGISEDSSVPEMNRDFYPLTKTQMGIYLEALTGGNAATYTLPYLMKAAEGVTAEKIIAAVKSVISAHPSMKYVIRAGADRIPHMFMTPDAPVEIPIVDGKSEDRLSFMERFVPVVAMTDEMLFHFAVYRTPECCYLAMKVHLIFFDASAISLFIAELNRALSGQTLTQEKFTVQQAAMIEEAKMQNGSHDKAAKYYTEMFRDVDDMPRLTGDIDGTLTPGVSRNMRYEPGTLTSAQVKAFCAEHQITESSFFLGAMALLLGKYLNTKHVTFSTVYNGRSLAGQESTLGTLIKRIPVYGNLSENLNVTDFLRKIGRQVFASMSNDIYSFDEVLKNCPVNEDIEFIYQGDLFTDNMGTSAGQNLIAGDSYFMEHYHTGMVTGCMSIQFFSTNGLYNMTLEYRNERFSDKFVRGFAEDFFTIAEGLLSSEDIGGVSMLSAEDRNMLALFNDTAVDIGFTPVHEQIHLHALNTPEKTAVTACGKSLTFRELDELANQIAFAIQEHGVRNETLTGILFDRSVWAYAAEIGILKAGGAFVPFIPEYPDERIEFCMSDGKIPILLTTKAIAENRPALGQAHRVVTLEELLGAGSLDEIQPSQKFTVPPEVHTDPNGLAYCIYTSGTTGRPKGVMIEHRNIANYVHRNTKSIEIMHYAEPGRVCLALASFSFDVSVVEEFVPLCNGNTVVIATEAEIHTPSLLAGLILKNSVNGITCTPTYLAGLLAIPAMDEALRQLTFYDIGAEAFPAQLFGKLRALREDSVILNVYGPTECTMGCAAEVMTDGKIITVGKPIANTKFYVSDTFGNELPAGIRGELIICGDQVGRGYVNLPDKTTAAFFVHDGMRAYHSGDLAAWTEDGRIRIFGRTDNQIKIRGFRIELDEIEKVIAEFPGVSAGAANVAKYNGTDYLAGYYTAEDGVSPEKLKAYIQDKLPEYMIPSVLVRLDSMPMTSSGKIDRRALPKPDFNAFRAEYAAPQTETEKLLCKAFAHAVNVPEEKIGVLDDFFELGGDSLRAMVVLSEADIDGLNAADIFQKRTPKAIAETLSERSHEKSIDEREDEARTLQHRLTPLQRQMIDVQLFRPGATMWSNMHILARFELSVDAERLCNALNKALQNHPSLSSAFFFNDNDELVQQYIPGLLREQKVHEISEATAEMLPAVLVTPIHKILDSCLCRVGVFRSPSYVYLFIDVHHMLMDGGSLSVLLSDIVRAYNGQELKKDYYFAIRQEEDKQAAAGKMQQAKDWFTENYGNEVWCNILPPDHDSKNINQAERIRRLRFTAEQVKDAEEYWGVTHSVMAISAALLALSRFTGKQHVMTNWIFNNRLAPEAENAVGMLIKNLPAAVRMEEVSSMRELLESVKEQVTEGIAHSEYDFMTEHYQPFVNDCMEVNLQLGINASELDSLNPTFIELEDDFTSAGARLELELLENEYGDGGFDSEMEYAEGLFDRQKMEKFHDLYADILEGLIAKKDNL
ncbi:MAG: amino acid adenylation domain-containing protein [Synergistaceae bacterium]|nr:amino acid adenylation domain-containing protein [Synergistaceae bacterium]